MYKITANEDGTCTLWVSLGDDDWGYHSNYDDRRQAEAMKQALESDAADFVERY